MVCLLGGFISLNWCNVKIGIVCNLWAAAGLHIGCEDRGRILAMKVRYIPLNATCGQLERVTFKALMKYLKYNKIIMVVCGIGWIAPPTKEDEEKELLKSLAKAKKKIQKNIKIQEWLQDKESKVSAAQQQEVKSIRSVHFRTQCNDLDELLVNNVYIV